MRQITAVAATLLLTGSAQAADPITTASILAGQVRTYGDVSDADRQMVDACRAAIAQWAAQYDPVELDIAMTGPVQSRQAGDRTAALFVEIDYNRQAGIETRSARIECTVAPDGAVAVAEAP